MSPDRAVPTFNSTDSAFGSSAPLPDRRTTANLTEPTVLVEFMFDVVACCRELLPAVLQAGCPAEARDPRTGHTLLTGILSSPAPLPPTTATGAVAAELFGGGSTIGDYGVATGAGGTAESGAPSATDRCRGVAVAAMAAAAENSLSPQDKHICLDLLLKHGVSPSEGNPLTQQTPLYLAASHHDLELVELLLQLIEARAPGLGVPASTTTYASTCCSSTTYRRLREIR